MDSSRTLCLLEDHSETSRGYFSSISNCELFFPTSKLTSEYSPSSCSLTPAFPGELDDETGKKSEETNQAESTCRYNNVSPAIQKIMRMMRLTPTCLSTLPTNRTILTKRRALSTGRLDRPDDKTANDDSICMLKRRLDASFSPDVASRRHSMDGRVSKTRESDSSMPTCRSRDFLDALANDEAVASVSHREIVATTDQASPQDYNYVSESYFLLMTSSRNQRMKNEASRGRP